MVEPQLYHGADLAIDAVIFLVDAKKAYAPERVSLNCYY